MERDGGVLERFDQPSTRFKNDEGQATRAYTDKSGSRTAAPPWNTEGRPVHFMRTPRRHRFLSLAKDTAQKVRYERDGVPETAIRYRGAIEFDFRQL